MEIFYHSHQLPKTFTHSHTDFEIMYCVSGSYVFHYLTADGERKEEPITPKRMIFIPSNMMHGVEQVTYPYTRFFMQFSEPCIIALLNKPQLLSPFQSSLTCTGKKTPVPRFLDASKSAEVIELLFKNMLDAFILSDVKNICTELHVMSLLGLAFCELHKNHPEFFLTAHSHRSAMIQEVRSFIDRNYDQQFTINDLAKRYYVHPDYLTHCFTNEVGESPKKYLSNLRLSIASKLLEASTDTVQKIAMRVGFANVNIFIRSFRTKYGITPKQYRKKVLSEFIG